MTSVADIAEPDAQADLRDWRLAMLKELAEIGMSLARELPAQAAAARQADAERSAPDPGLAFSRISRAVRLTIALQTRILEGPDIWERGLPASGRADEPRPAAAKQPAAATATAAEDAAAIEDLRTTGRLRRAMTRFIAGTAIEAPERDGREREASETERLFAALDARLDREGEDDADFAEVEVKALALSICRDLGVDPGPDWWREGWEIEAPPPKAAAFGSG